MSVSNFAAIRRLREMRKWTVFAEGRNRGNQFLINVKGSSFGAQEPVWGPKRLAKRFRTRTEAEIIRRSFAPRATEIRLE